MAMEENRESESRVLLWIPPHRFNPRGLIELILGSALVVVLFFAACDTGSDSTDYLAVYEVRVTEDESFLLAVATPEQMQLAEQRMAEGPVGAIHGEVVRGDGGFNQPYGWHLVPSSVTFPDMTMELCDGRPNSDVQSNIDYWVDTVKYYCPWGAEIVRRVE